MPDSLSGPEVNNDRIATLYRNQHETMLRFARLLLGSPEEADEVVQEIYLKLMESRATLPAVIERSWLYRVVLNACRDHRKKWWSQLRRRSIDAGVLESLRDREPTPENRLLDNERQAALARILGGVPKHLRTALILRDVEGLSYTEIASVLGCSVGTVSSRLNRGREMVARKLRGGSG